MVPNVVVAFYYYYQVLCKEEEVSCVHAYTASDEYHFMTFRVKSLLRRWLLSRVMCTCIYDS